MLTYIITACMTTALMMAGSSLGDDRKPQMEIDVAGTTDIVPPLTQSLNLTCSLVPAADSDPKDDKADFSSITGVLIDLKIPGGSADANVAKITSVEPDKPTLSGLLPRATIIGFDLSEGLIEVGVTAPDSNHAGDYTCKVLGFNTDEYPVTLKHEVSVQNKAPDVKKLANYVHNLELQLDKKDALLENKDALLEKKDALLENKDALLENKDASQDTEISNIKKDNGNLYNWIKDNKYLIQQYGELIVRVNDIQGDWTECYPGHTGDDWYVKQVNFPHRYTKGQIRVFTSVISVTAGNYYPGAGRTDYSVYAGEVSLAGFKLNCKTLEHSYISSMWVSWIAFPVIF